MLSLDEIERTPERIRELSPYDAQEMLARIAALIPPLNARVVAAIRPAQEDRIISVKDAAALCNKTSGWVYEHSELLVRDKNGRGALTLRSNNSYGESYERRRPNLQAQRFDDLAYSGLDSRRASRVEAIDQHR